MEDYKRFWNWNDQYSFFLEVLQTANSYKKVIKLKKKSKLEKVSKNYFKIFCIRQGTLFSLTTNESFSSEKGYVRSRLGWVSTEYRLLWDDSRSSLESAFASPKDARKEHGLMIFPNNGFISLKKRKENICLGTSSWYLHILICCLATLSRQVTPTRVI